MGNRVAQQQNPNNGRNVTGVAVIYAESCGANQNPIAAIDISLEPDASMMPHAKAANAHLCSRPSPKGFAPAPRPKSPRSEFRSSVSYYTVARRPGKRQALVSLFGSGHLVGSDQTDPVLQPPQGDTYPGEWRDFYISRNALFVRRRPSDQTIREESYHPDAPVSPRPAANRRSRVPVRLSTTISWGFEHFNRAYNGPIQGRSSLCAGNTNDMGFLLIANMPPMLPALTSCRRRKNGDKILNVRHDGSTCRCSAPLPAGQSPQGHNHQEGPRHAVCRNRFTRMPRRGK
jgi:hypothetical protein